MRFVRLTLALMFALAVACNAGGGTPQPVEAGSSGPDGGATADTCFEDAGFWYCPGNNPQPVPACPDIMNPDTPCNYDGGGCFYCDIEGAGAGCRCDTSNSAALDAGDGGTWDCIASNYLCK